MPGQFFARAPLELGATVAHCTFRPYLPGVPGCEPYLAQAWKIAGIVGRSTRVYLGASEYGALVRELMEEAETPRGTYPKSLKFGRNPCVHFINAGTDDYARVAQLNWGTAGARDFKGRAAALRTAKEAQMVPKEPVA